jgi:hypothetical protein
VSEYETPSDSLAHFRRTREAVGAWTNDAMTLRVPLLLLPLVLLLRLIRLPLLLLLLMR